MSNHPGSEYICFYCGKNHIRRPGNIYKLQVDKRIVHFCGYNCYRSVEKLLKEKRIDELQKLIDAYIER